MQIELLNDQGQAASKFDAPETVFGREYNEDLIHQIANDEKLTVHLLQQGWNRGFCTQASL